MYYTHCWRPQGIWWLVNLPPASATLPNRIGIEGGSYERINGCLSLLTSRHRLRPWAQYRFGQVGEPPAKTGMPSKTNWETAADASAAASRLAFSAYLLPVLTFSLSLCVCVLFNCKGHSFPCCGLFTGRSLKLSAVSTLQVLLYSDICSSCERLPLSALVPFKGRQKQITF